MFRCTILFPLSLGVVACLPPVVPHGALVPPGSVVVNQTATVQCEDGYRLTGLPTVKCVLVAGQRTPTWNANISGCESECVYPCIYADVYVSCI